MSNAQDIQDELNSMGSPLAGLPRTMPYAVPQDYFEQLSSTLSNAAAGPEQAPAWSTQMPYDVPAGYFEALPDEVSALTAVTSLPAGNPYSIPDGYFEALPALVLQAVRTDPADMPQKRWKLPKSLRWAAAAVLITGMGVGFYDIMSRPHQSLSGTEKILSSLPGNELQEYVQRTYYLNVDNVVRKNPLSNMQLDNKEIIKYLNENGWD